MVWLVGNNNFGARCLVEIGRNTRIKQLNVMLNVSRLWYIKYVQY
jgi:hypothetical protein